MAHIVVWILDLIVTWNIFKLYELFARPSLRLCQRNVIRELELGNVAIVERPTCRDALAGVRVDKVALGVPGRRILDRLFSRLAKCNPGVRVTGRRDAVRLGVKERQLLVASATRPAVVDEDWCGDGVDVEVVVTGG